MHKRHFDRRVRFPYRGVLIKATNHVVETRNNTRRLEWIMQRLSTTRSNNFIRWATMRPIRGFCRCKPPPRPGTLYGNFWIPLRSLITIVFCGFCPSKSNLIFLIIYFSQFISPYYTYFLSCDGPVILYFRNA